MRNGWMVATLVAAALVGASLATPAGAAVLCQRKNKVKIRPDACKPKETLVQDLGAQAQQFADLVVEPCAGDPSRALATAPRSFLFDGNDCTGGCRRFDGDEAGCNGAFQVTWDGAAACFYAQGKCVSCLGCAERAGLCTDRCQPAPCADATRTRFTGGPNTAACDQLATEMECNTGYAMQYGRRPASCYWDAIGARCRGCGENNEADGNCTNTCRAADKCKNPNLVWTSYCGRHDGDQTACEAAWAEGGGGSLREAYSCYWAAADSRCRECRTLDEIAGHCTDTCESWPAP